MYFLSHSPRIFWEKSSKDKDTYVFGIWERSKITLLNVHKRGSKWLVSCEASKADSWKQILGRKEDSQRTYSIASVGSSTWGGKNLRWIISDEELYDILNLVLKEAKDQYFRK